MSSPPDSACDLGLSVIQRLDVPRNRPTAVSEIMQLIDKKGRWAGIALAMVVMASLGGTLAARPIVTVGDPADLPKDLSDLALVDRLGSDKPGVATRAGSILIARREELIAALIARLEAGHDALATGPSRAATARLLGEFRAVEAVPTLIRAWLDPTMPENRPEEQMWTNIDGPHHAAELALIAIGRPAITPLLRLIAEDKDPDHRTRALMLLVYLTDDRRSLLEMLEWHAAQDPDPTEAGRFRAAREMAERIVPADSRPRYRR